MSRGKAKSQWDFGELFPPEQTRRVLTVTELTGNVRKAIEKDVGEVWVTGEVTNLRAQASGHCYFTLKDVAAQLSCVLFRGEAAANREFLQDGQKLLLHGNVTVYEARGQYQLMVRTIEPQGVGALQLAFEKLKRRLQAEGLFASERKRSLPRYPRRIGLVTSPTGAAIRDVLHVIGRRQPSLEIILAPCRVQGDGAAAEIAAAVRLLNAWFTPNDAERSLDLILITRGGGSLEDLWAFNEEVVARAVFDSAVPVVSAVGHEIDFSISDFVADLRAATPSAAAELITEGPFASRQVVQETGRRIAQLARRQIEAERETLLELAQRIVRVHPRRQLRDKAQQIDGLAEALSRNVQRRAREQRTRLREVAQRLARLKPAAVVALQRQSLHGLERRLSDSARRAADRKRHLVTPLSQRLRLLDPDNVLARGYSITTDAANGAVLRSAGDALPGQELHTRLHSGEVRSVVK